MTAGFAAGRADAFAQTKTPAAARALPGEERLR